MSDAPGGGGFGVAAGVGAVTRPIGEPNAPIHFEAYIGTRLRIQRAFSRPYIMVRHVVLSDVCILVDYHLIDSITFILRFQI